MTRFSRVSLFAVVLGLIVLCTHGEESSPFPSETEHASFLEEFKASHPPRTPSDHSSKLHNAVQDKAALFFRSLDADHDKLVSVEDVYNSADKINARLPGISVDEFASFIQAADTDGDKKMNMQEMVAAFEQGLSGTELVETQTKVRSRTGILGGVKDFVGKKWNQFKNRMSGAVDTSQDACVMCQYIVQRCEVNVKQAGIIAGMSHMNGPVAPSSWLEVKAEVKTETTQPFDMAAANIIGATRDSTRFTRLAERQKYNEIYRVVDVTLDDVCEQGMPNKYYGYCKAVYQVQSDVVDGLRFQYRPSDVCYRIGMCGSKSYITQGVHSRY